MVNATRFEGGRIYTGRRYVEALVVEDGRVVAAGALGAIGRATPTGADRVDLGGRLAVPGLADAHLHLAEIVRTREGLEVGSARSIPELLGRLALPRPDRGVGAIVGRGLDPERLAERRWPTPAELDSVVADRPVVLYHASGHAALLNSRAWEEVLATPSRPRGSDRLPAGVVAEEGLATLRPIAREALPLRAEAVAAVLRELVRLGLTAVGTMTTSREELDLLEELDRRGHLPLRVVAYPPLDDLSRIPGPAGIGPAARLRIGGVKVFLDGAFGPRTASLAAPYADDPSTAGIDRGDDAELAPLLEEARRRGLTPALHAIGDRAVGRAIRLVARSAGAAPPPRLEHASLTPPSLLGPLRAVGARLVVQPGFVWSDHWLGRRLDHDRVRWAYAFRTLRDAGLELAGSSDAPFDPLDPWRGVRAAVERRDELGRSANSSPGEALPAEEALGLYTRGASLALGRPGAGSLEPGSPADLAVLEAPRLADALRASGPIVRATWVAGVAFRDDGHDRPGQSV